MPGARVLLVEDDDVLCDVIGRNLRARGHTVTVALDVQSAIEYLRTKEFDLIVLDINLPDQTGWDVLRAAREKGYIHPIEEDGNKLPVVVLSAVRVSPHRLAEFRPLAYLPKPFPMDALLRLAAEAAQHGKAPSHNEGASMGDSENPQTNEEELRA
ncbi:MAG TPA: response regulator [Ktedonobacteraceae bacterium]|jgi:DNA-binding response OmpR family regulator|nr:response regulator [Ktedonobacteraceae bacterium]